MRGWLWVIVFPGCASGETETVAQPVDAAVDTFEVAVDTNVTMEASPEDTTVAPTDAIFPTEEDVAISDVKSCDGCIDVDVNVVECAPVSCPAAFPFVVGCSIKMGGSGFTGCVAHAPGSASVAFKIGSGCGSMAIEPKITGLIRCSKVDGPQLDAMNCPISTPIRRYVSSLAACPS